jgi:carbamoyltransferase
VCALPDRTGRAIRTILAVNFNHDGSGVLLVDGRIRGYVNTERFSRLKKHPGLREEDLDELLDQAGVGLAEVDHVLLCNLHNMDSPDIAALHGTDLKETWLEFWVNQTNSVVDIRGRRIPCTVNPDHHLIHAAAAYFTAPFDSGVALAIDPLGCRSFLGRQNRLYPLLLDFDSWFNANHGYCSVSEHLFGSTLIGAGKVMGLAPYGRPDDDGDGRLPADVRTFEQLLALAEEHPRYVMVDGRKLNATLAYYIQLGLEQQVCRVYRELAGVAARNGVAPAIAVSGGTSLNAIANQLAFQESGLESMHLHPACGDDGTAIGAALWYWHHVLGRPRQPHRPDELMYSRREYPGAEVRRALDAYAGRVEVEHTGDYVERAAELVSQGAVVGWFDGAGEVGPRALGHRSILADPRDPGIQDRINSTVKFREHFRPFAPSVLNERSLEWFGIKDSPYMLRAAPVLREGVPGITHVDRTARVQTVARSDNARFHDLIRAFERRTGVPLVLNTSLNTKGEPIAETPADALNTLLNCALDYLAMPGVIVRRTGSGAMNAGLHHVARARAGRA